MKRTSNGKWIFGIRETYPEGKFTERSDAGHPDSGALKAGARRNPGSFRAFKQTYIKVVRKINYNVVWDIRRALKRNFEEKLVRTAFIGRNSVSWTIDVLLEPGRTQ
uniref:Uncharacterized protein n=1 Tax=Vespula pensylvanica TaxID=30213 RepID=A0A834UCL1_VESPE|nr:hypothetical protein H0235_006386 [Vespula pensylvanica]